MGKRLFILFLFLSIAIDGYCRTVYSTKSASASRYHLSSDCQGLKKNTIGIRSLTESEAISEGKTLCKICQSHEGPEASSSSGSPTPKAETVPGQQLTPLYNSSPSSIPFDNTKLEIAKVRMGIAQELIQHIGYAVSYNEELLISNWVAWELTNQEVEGSYKRPNRPFEPDPDVHGKSGEHRDYSNSGYSRGHMAPAADMKWSEQAMNESFYMSNVCPQSAALNTSMWNRLENKTRAIAGQGSSVYVCCGPIVEANAKRIGSNGVAVPSYFFKVMIRKRAGKWVGIGFIFPNEECKGGMFDYAMTIDEVEERTGIDFFFNLPDEIENETESQWSQSEWQ